MKEFRKNFLNVYESVKVLFISLEHKTGIKL